MRITIISASARRTPNGEPADRIYNGARDNAAGVALVLAIGRAFAALPERPARSVLLMFPAAEEQGLLGSEYFAKHPTVPPGKIAADVNFDSPNIWGVTRDITFIGLGKSPSLDAVATEVAAYQQRALKADQFPERGIVLSLRSVQPRQDRRARVLLERRHRLSRQAAGLGRRADRRATSSATITSRATSSRTTGASTGMVQDAQFGFFAGLIVANERAMPIWSAGNEFAATRRAALAAAGTDSPR